MNQILKAREIFEASGNNHEACWEELGQYDWDELTQDYISEHIRSWPLWDKPWCHASSLNHLSEYYEGYLSKALKLGKKSKQRIKAYCNTSSTYHRNLNCLDDFINLELLGSIDNAVIEGATGMTPTRIKYLVTQNTAPRNTVFNIDQSAFINLKEITTTLNWDTTAKYLTTSRKYPHHLFKPTINYDALNEWNQLEYTKLIISNNSVGENYVKAIKNNECPDLVYDYYKIEALPNYDKYRIAKSRSFYVVEVKRNKDYRPYTRDIRYSDVGFLDVKLPKG